MDQGFPQRLQRLRERRRMSRKTLGELCGLSKNIIGQYERGRKKPSAEKLELLAEALETTMDHLWAGRAP